MVVGVKTELPHCIYLHISNNVLALKQRHVAATFFASAQLWMFKIIQYLQI